MPTGPGRPISRHGNKWSATGAKAPIYLLPPHSRSTIRQHHSVRTFVAREFIRNTLTWLHTEFHRCVVSRSAAPAISPR